MWKENILIQDLKLLLQTLNQYCTCTLPFNSSLLSSTFSFLIIESGPEFYLIFSANSILAHILSYCQEPDSTLPWLHCNWTEGCPCSHFRGLLPAGEGVNIWIEDHPGNKF